METAPQPSSLPVPTSWRGKFLYALLTMVLPVACFAASPVLRPEWQSGKTSAYAALLLDPHAAVFFFPFLLYSMVCIGLLLYRPERFAARFAVRLGIYTGVFLALQYLVIVAIAAEVPIWIADGVFFGLVLLYWGAKTKFGQRGVKVFSLLIAVGGVLLFAISVVGSFRWGSLGFENFIRSLWSALSGIPFFLLAGIFILAPCFCITCMGLTAFKLLKTYETNPLLPWIHSFGWLTWLGGMMAAWQLSILEMFKIYAGLPPQPPDCYIATAAARGHRQVVRSQLVVVQSGQMWVNPQLQILKCAELTLMALTPRLHHLLRALYDVVGYALAKRLTNPFLADLAYLTLKPFEWAAALALKTIVPEIDNYSSQLYNPR
jgi:hypothetical protein